MSISVRKKVSRLIISFLIVFVTMLCCFSSIGHAAINEVETTTFVITGDFTDTFRLDSNRDSLFALKKAVPGDSWEGKIEIRNETEDIMDISLLSIDNKLLDKTLFEILELEIAAKDVVLYSGSYSTDSPIIRSIKLPAGKSLTLDITVTLPISAGNEIQNRKMSSVWVFEAKSDYKPSGVDTPQTGVDLMLDTIRDGSVLWLLLISLLGAAIIGGKIYTIKKTVNSTERGGVCDEEK